MVNMIKQEFKDFESQIGVQMVRPSAAFADKQKRFESPKKIVAKIGDDGLLKAGYPGPGEYHNELKWVKTLTKDSSPSEYKVRQQRINVTAPSIPSH